MSKAKQQNLTPLQVSTLASIVQKETAVVRERKTVAGLYLNRLHDYWPLQADPTIIFALLAVPLAVRATSGARARGFLYSAGMVGVYYYVGRAAELAARSDRFHPVVAAWLPNLLGLIVLVILLHRLPRSAT